jgi:polysaccharide deacetylase 2 family uncharacterized protein YibQ
VFSVSSVVVSACLGLAPALTDLPMVALIIDDIGNNYATGRDAIELPHDFAYAMLPFSPHTKNLAHLANSLGKDVIAHLPMEADQDNHLLGSGALMIDMPREEFDNTLLESITAVPHAIGVNNHMGSRLTRESAQMRWLMQAIHERGGLFFVDSRTTTRSVALRWARRSDVAATFRDIFLDNVKSRIYIEKQLENLVAKAKRDGHALSIAHPHRLTIDVLRTWQPAETGVRLVKISEYVETHRYAANMLSTPLQVSIVAATERTDNSDNADPTKYPNAQR